MSYVEATHEEAKAESTATPLSTLIFAVASGYMASVDAQLANTIEWDQMPYNQKVKGKQSVMRWMKAGSQSEKKPEVIN
jgi:hypothetical protein